MKSTTDFQIMLTWLDGITTSGENSCGEYAMTGILKGNFKLNHEKLIISLSIKLMINDCEQHNIGCFAGIEMSNNDSNIYFVTGADAKDVYLKQGVINGLKAKRLKLIAFLNDNCSRRRKRGANGKKIPGFYIYIFLSEHNLIFTKNYYSRNILIIQH